MGRWGEWPPLQSHTTQSWELLSLYGPLYFRSRWLNPPQGMSSVGWYDEDSGVWGYCIPPGWYSKERVPHPGNVASEVWERDSAQGSWWLSLQLSSWNCKSQYLLRKLYSTPHFLLRSPRWVSVNDILCRYLNLPCKRAPGSLADSHLSLVERFPADFYSQMLWRCPFPALLFWAENSGMGLRPHFP